MNRKEAEELQARLLALIGPEKFDVTGIDELTRRFAVIAEISAKVDLIQKLSRRASGLLARCEFSQMQRVRRLLTIRPAVWRDLECLWARQIIQAIETLQTESGPQAALALACFGVWRADLDEAILLAEKALAPDPSPSMGVEQAPEPVKAGKRPTPPAKEKMQPKVLGSLEELDTEDLDPQTLADIEALRAEVAALNNAKA